MKRPLGNHIQAPSVGIVALRFEARFERERERAAGESAVAWRQRPSKFARKSSDLRCGAKLRVHLKLHHSGRLFFFFKHRTQKTQKPPTARDPVKDPFDTFWGTLFEISRVVAALGVEAEAYAGPRAPRAPLALAWMSLRCILYVSWMSLGCILEQDCAKGRPYRVFFLQARP